MVSLQRAGVQMGKEDTGVGCGLIAGSRALGGGEIRRLQNWEGACLFSNVGMWLGHMPVIRTVEGKRSPTRWTIRSGCPGGGDGLGYEQDASFSASGGRQGVGVTQETRVRGQPRNWHALGSGR